MLKSKISLVIAIFVGVASVYGQEKDKEKTTDIKEVVVTATRSLKKLKDVPIPVQVVTSEDIKKSQATDFQSFLENEFSGINFVYNGGSPNINMMGFGGKYILFLIDGERVAGETFDNIDYDRIDIDNIERIEIIKGASSSLYGSNAIGGVINIITKKAKNPLELVAGALYDTNRDFKANLSAGTKQKWGAFSLSTFYKYREPYVITDQIPSAQGTYSQTNIAGFENYAINPKLSFNITPKIDLTLTPSYYFSERNVGDANSKILRDRYYNYSGALKSNLKLTDDKTLTISGAYDQYDKYDYYVKKGTKEKNYENQIWRAGAQYNQNLFQRHTFVAGAEVLSDQLLSYMFGNQRKYAKTYTVFTQQDWVISPNFTLVTGGRMDYHTFFKEFFTFRFSGMYKFQDVMTLRASYSGGFRSPTLKELYTDWFHPWGGGFQVVGNKDLTPESSNNYNLSVDFSVNNKLNITLMTQYSQIKDKISTTWKTASRDTIQYANFNGKSDVIGSEVSVAYRLNKFFNFRTSYSFYNIVGATAEERPHTLTFKAEYNPHKLYHPNIIISGKYLSGITYSQTAITTGQYENYNPYSMWRFQMSMRMPYNFVINCGINNIFDYVPQRADFLTAVTPGRTFYVGARWNFNKKSVYDSSYDLAGM